MSPNKFSIHVITDLLWYRIFDGLDLAEELMWRIVIERKLSIEHCVQQHSKSPHVTWLAVIKPACNITTTTSLCSASSMTLPAFAADRYVPAMGCSAANLLDATAAVDRWTDRRTDAQPFHIPCCAYYAGSIYNDNDNNNYYYTCLTDSFPGRPG